MNVILTPGAKLRSSQGMKKMWLPDLQWQSYEWMARNHGVQSCRSTSITLQPEMRSSGVSHLRSVGPHRMNTGCDAWPDDPGTRRLAQA